MSRESKGIGSAGSRKTVAAESVRDKSRIVKKATARIDSADDDNDYLTITVIVGRRLLRKHSFSHQ